GDEAGMRHGSHRPSLFLEAACQHRVARQVRQEDLDRDAAVEAFVVSAKDGRHATGAERRKDPVAVDQAVAGGGHRPRLADAIDSAPPNGGPMFSTLLGPLPAPPGADATSAGDSADPVAVVLAALDEIGLELVTTGAPSASPDLAAADIVEGWREAAALSARP